MFGYFADQIVNFSENRRLRLPVDLNVRHQALRRKINDNLQSFVAHDLLFFPEHPIQVFWRKKLTFIRGQLLLRRHNFEMESINSFDDEVPNLLTVGLLTLLHSTVELALWLSLPGRVRRDLVESALHLHKPNY